MDVSVSFICGCELRLFVFHFLSFSVSKYIFVKFICTVTAADPLCVCTISPRGCIFAQSSPRACLAIQIEWPKKFVFDMSLSIKCRHQLATLCVQFGIDQLTHTIHSFFERNFHDYGSLRSHYLLDFRNRKIHFCSQQPEHLQLLPLVLWDGRTGMFLRRQVAALIGCYFC